MALICMACFDTEENQRSAYTNKTLEGLLKTVDFSLHRLVVIDNNSCNDTQEIIHNFGRKFPNKSHLFLIRNDRNLGTAKAINQGIKLRKHGEHVVKMDNDCTIDDANWIDQMEECIRREPRIGIVALKRKDLQNHPDHSEKYFRSELMMLPHKPGENWLVVEKVSHIMGTCEMISSLLLEKIGGFEQPTVYGYDDTIVFHKSEILKYFNVYLPHISIHHLDTGGTEHTYWKVKHSQEHRKSVDQYLHELKRGRKPLFYDIHQD